MIILLTEGNHSDYNVVGLVDVPLHEARPWLESRQAEADHKLTRPPCHIQECRSFHRGGCAYCSETDRLRANADKAAQDLHSRCAEMLSRNPMHRNGFAPVGHLEVRRDA